MKKKSFEQIGKLLEEIKEVVKDDEDKDIDKKTERKTEITKEVLEGAIKLLSSTVFEFVIGEKFGESMFSGNDNPEVADFARKFGIDMEGINTTIGNIVSCVKENPDKMVSTLSRIFAGYAN